MASPTRSWAGEGRTTTSTTECTMLVSELQGWRRMGSTRWPNMLTRSKILRWKDFCKLADEGSAHIMSHKFALFWQCIFPFVCRMIHFVFYDWLAKKWGRFSQPTFQIISHFGINVQTICLFRYTWNGINKLNYTLLSREGSKTVYHFACTFGYGYYCGLWHLLKRVIKAYVKINLICEVMELIS